MSDVRPPALNLKFRPGTTITITLTGWTPLIGRTFQAFLGSDALALTIVGDVMTIVVDNLISDNYPTAITSFVLNEQIDGTMEAIIIGRWTPSLEPRETTTATQTHQVSQGAVSLTVQVNSAQASILSLSARSALESIGAQVDQSTARTLEARFLQFIRDAGSGSPPAGWNYLGGDVPDAVFIPSSNDVLWIFADGFDGTTINASDLYVSSPLPIRNGAILEQTAGTFTGAIQLYETGASGLWLNAVAQGGLAAGTIWWPIGLIDDNGTYRVACWHVESPAAAGEPHGRLIDSHIITLNGFLGYGSHVATGLGGITDNFWISGMWRDTSHTYIVGMQFVPPFDDRKTATPTAPNYVFGDPQNHYSLTRIARVANGSLTTVASWTFWNGTTWVSGSTNATALVDTAGNQIRGDSGIKKITDTHYLMIAHALMDSHLDVYKAAAPQGPWTQIARVPLPTQGHKVNGPNTFEVGQLCKILPSQVQAPPAEHSIAVISRNTIVPTLGYAAEEAFTSRNIRRYAPQFAVIPHN